MIRKQSFWKSPHSLNLKYTEHNMISFEVGSLLYLFRLILLVNLTSASSNIGFQQVHILVWYALKYRCRCKTRENIDTSKARGKKINIQKNTQMIMIRTPPPPPANNVDHWSNYCLIDFIFLCKCIQSISVLRYIRF